MTDPQSPVLSPQSSASFQEEEIDLGDYIATILEAKWLIASVAAIIFLAGLAYVFMATPIYSADALVQVEKETQGMGPLDDLNSVLTGETPAEAEIEIIRSRSVVGKAVDQLGLTLSAGPHHFPFIGGYIARSNRRAGPSKPFLGFNSYAWGGERLKIKRLSVPGFYENKHLTLIAGEAGHFILSGPDDERLLEGEAGKAAVANVAGPDDGEHPVKMFVSELIARPQTRFDVTRASWLESVEGLQAGLKVSEKGKKTGIMELRMEGSDPGRIVAIVNAIANIYLRQNVERKSAEAKKTLDFLNQQLPDLKTGLDEAEAALNEYRATKGSVDLSLETRAMLDQGAEIETELSKLKLKRDELRQRFQARHPVLRTMEAKIKRLNNRQARLNVRVQRLPKTEQELLKLTRTVKVKTELYTLLLNKAQELKVVKAGTVGNVRIIDYAVVPELPVKPKKTLIAALSLTGGLFLGVLLAFVRRSLQQGVEDPNEIEQRLGVPVFAMVPHSDTQMALSGQIHGKSKKNSILAMHDHKDMAIESLRSLRTNLHFALMEAKNNIVVIAGPSPGVGKSFVSVNFAHVLADAGQRVLLIDGDLRKGHLHNYFGMKRSPGLSDVISGTVGLAAAIRRISAENVSFLSTGTLPPNPSEVLMNERFEELVTEAAGKFDLVLIDTPPILAVTDATIIAKFASTTFLLVRYAVNPLREIELAIKRLSQSGVRTNGVIFNDLQRRAGRYGYGYGYYGKYGAYQYEYKREKGKERD